MASLRDELTGIYQQRGVLTPEVVVDEARPPTAPLHDRFEWDDSTAAEAYRRDQAHRLIQSVRLPIVYQPSDGKPVKVRAFQAMRTEQGNVYKPTEEVVQDPFLTKLVLQNMQREWAAMKARYDSFSEFYAMVRNDVEQAAFISWARRDEFRLDVARQVRARQSRYGTFSRGAVWQFRYGQVGLVAFWQRTARHGGLG